MKDLFVGILLGLPAGIILSYFYASSAIAEYRRAASDVNVFFHTVEGKLTAVRKAL